MAAAFRRVCSRYNRQLEQRPILVQSATTSVLFAAGDVLAQHAVEQRSSHDSVRTVRFSAFGGCLAGPCMALWYRVLQRAVTFRSIAKCTLARVALDQFVFAPPSIAIFFTAQGILEGKTMDEIRAKLHHTYFNTLVANWTVWPAVQLVNFRFVPLNYRLMFVNVLAVGWNCYLSAANAKKHISPPPDPLEQQWVF